MAEAKNGMIRIPWCKPSTWRRAVSTYGAQRFDVAEITESCSSGAYPLWSVKLTTYSLGQGDVGGFQFYCSHSDLDQTTWIDDTEYYERCCKRTKPIIYARDLVPDPKGRSVYVPGPAREAAETFLAGFADLITQMVGLEGESPSESILTGDYDTYILPEGEDFVTFLVEGWGLRP